MTCGLVAVMRLGAAVRVLGDIPWVTRARCFYWGDIDTFGFEILNRARSVLPDVQSVLMSADTLLDQQALCVTEPTQVTASELPLLDEHEREVFDGLRSNRWGTALRLEQERIAWAVALRELRTWIGNDGAAAHRPAIQPAPPTALPDAQPSCR
jgi:hypothetical protein